MKKFFRNLYHYRHYMLYSAKAQLNSELANSWLGGLWWVLEPSLFMLVYLFVFSVVFHRTTTYLVAFINLGLLYWRFFQNTVLNSIVLIKRYRAVISKVYIPKYVLLSSLMLVNLFKLLCGFFPQIIAMVLYRVPISWYMLNIIPITLLLIVLTFGVSCGCMHIGVFLEDLSKLMHVGLQMVFYVSGVFYPIRETLNETLSKYLLAYNPIALILDEVRNALLYAQPMNWKIIVIDFLIASALVSVSVRAVSRSEGQYVKVL